MAGGLFGGFRELSGDQPPERNGSWICEHEEMLDSHTHCDRCLQQTVGELITPQIQKLAQETVVKHWKSNRTAHLPCGYAAPGIDLPYPNIPCFN